MDKPDREVLEAEANRLGLKFSPSIGDEKLEERITEATTVPSLDAKIIKPDAIAKIAEPKSKPVLEVVGPEKGFCRAGRRFGAKPVQIPLDELSETELTAIQADPKLIAVIRNPDA